MIFHVSFAKTYLGKVDEVSGQSIMTQFLCINWFLPVIPLGSYYVLRHRRRFQPGRPLVFDAIRISMNWKSIFAEYFRLMGWIPSVVFAVRVMVMMADGQPVDGSDIALVIIAL